jgi:flavodoxin
MPLQASIFASWYTVCRKSKWRIFMSKELIAFYSRAGENYVSGLIKTIDVGNTEMAARIIQELTDADLFKIEQITPYSRDYNTCIAQAQADQKQNARPELKAYLPSLDAYDTIYLGYPNYWNTMPMAVFTFLEQYDWKGKKIKPFCTHEGSGMGSSQQDIQKLCFGAEIQKGLSIRGGRVEQSKSEIQHWINMG